jgi:hypothetical protein
MIGGSYGLGEGRKERKDGDRGFFGENGVRKRELEKLREICGEA